MKRGNPNFSQSIITQKNGYVTVMTITKNFIIVPKTVGYDYIPREHLKKKTKN
tara:strand:- start:1180 stop:1338 length:159 start_codon:yes stop_codon:yes gene_type:complete